MSIYDKIKNDTYKNSKPFSSDPAVRSAYRAEGTRLHAEFKKDLEEEFADSSWPQSVLNALYSKAWEDGHASGCHEVAGVYSDLIALVDVAFKAGKTA